MNADDSARLARIETKLDIVIDKGLDHEARLRSGERERWITRVGLIGLVAFVCGKLGLPLPAIFS